MINNKVIAITLYRRPKYTRQVLDALKQCYGIEDYTVMFSCDVDARYQEACDESIDLAVEFATNHGSTSIRVNNPRLGINWNKFFLLPRAYQLSDYVIFLEDDCVPAKDTLRFFEHMGERFRDNSSVISITGYSKPDNSAGLYDIFCGQGFTPWGWGMWKDRYMRIVGDGSAFKAHYKAAGRDESFDNWMCINTGPDEVHYGPVQPRIQCIGAEDAEHTPSKDWHMNRMYQQFGAWNYDLPEPTPDMWDAIKQ